MSAMRSHRENAEGSVTLPVRGEPDPAEITEDRAMSGDAENSADLFHGDFSGAAPAAEPAEKPEKQNERNRRRKTDNNNGAAGSELRTGRVLHMLTF